MGLLTLEESVLRLKEWWHIQVKVSKIDSKADKIGPGFRFPKSCLGSTLNEYFNSLFRFKLEEKAFSEGPRSSCL